MAAALRATRGAPAGDIIPVAALAGAGLGAFYTDAPDSGMDNWAD